MEKGSRIPWFTQLGKHGQVRTLICHIKDLIIDGYLKVGDQMLQPKEYSDLLDTTARTVQNAYKPLTESGILARYPGQRGIFVARNPVTAYDAEPPPASYPFNDEPVCPGICEPFLKLGSNSAKGVLPPGFDKPHGPLKQYYHRQSEPVTQALLKRRLREILSDRNIVATDSQVQLINSQGRHLTIIAVALVRHGEGVVLTSPREKAVSAFELQRASLHFTGIEPDGMNVDELERICQDNKISFVFVRPEEDYPYCVTLSLRKRKRIFALSEKYGFGIIEMYKEQEFLPKERNRSFWEFGGHDRVIHLTSVSRMDENLNAMGIVVAAPDAIARIEGTVARFGRREARAAASLAAMVGEDQLNYYSSQMKPGHAEIQQFMTGIGENYFAGQRCYFSRSGWAMWVEFNEEIHPPAEVFEELERLGVYKREEAEPFPTSVKRLLLGFGGHPVKVMDDALKYLLGRKVIEKVYAANAFLLPVTLLAM